MFGIGVHEPFEQADRESLSFGFGRENGWGKLAMVPSQDNTAAAQQGDPTSGLRRLTSFVNHCQLELPLTKYFAVESGRGGTQDRGLIQNMLDRHGLDPPRVGQ